MKIDVSKLLVATGNEEEIKDCVSFDFKSDELKLTSPISLDLKLINTGRTILLKGEIAVEAELECARCLSPFRQSLKAFLEEEFRVKKEEDDSLAEEVFLSEEDFVFTVEKDLTLDLSEIIRQNLILGLPIKPLCQKECQGIKDEGAPLRRDPRFASLKGDFYGSSKEETQ